MLGIDLGTSSTVAYFALENGRCDKMALSNKFPGLPSIVVITENEEIVIGEAFLTQQYRYPGRFIYNTKRLIGKKLEDPEVQRLFKNCEYKLVEDKDGYAMISVDDKQYRPEEISAMILKHIKDSFYKMTKIENPKCIITVPSYFNNIQREATKRAAAIAGLDLIQLYNESTAASIECYDLLKDTGHINEANIMIFDFGAGTLDVTIINVKDNVYKVLSTYGNSQLGGADIDVKLVEFAIDNFKKKHSNYEYDENDVHHRMNMCNLRLECRRVKENFKYVKNETITVPMFWKGEDLDVKLTKNRFERIIKDIIDKITVPIEKALEMAHLKKEDLNAVVPVGGSSNLEAVRDKLIEFFESDKIIYEAKDLFTVVAEGAIRMCLIHKKRQEMPADNVPGENVPVFIDTQPISIGIKTDDDVFQPFILSGFPIPQENTFKFDIIGGQSKLNLEIYQGEDNVCSNNILLHSINIPNIPKGVKKLRITLKVDSDTILYVSIVQEETNTSSNIEFKLNYSQEEIEQCKQKIEQMTENNHIIGEIDSVIDEIDEKLSRWRDKAAKKEISDEFGEFQEKYGKIERLAGTQKSFLVSLLNEAREILNKIPS